MASQYSPVDGRHIDISGVYIKRNHGEINKLLQQSKSARKLVISETTLKLVTFRLQKRQHWVTDS
jgi:hypothetical protein